MIEPKKTYPRMSEVALALATRQPRSPISYAVEIKDRAPTSTVPGGTLVSVSASSDAQDIAKWVEAEYDRLHKKYGNGAA